MSIIETYKQEIEAELDLAREKLVELRTNIRGLSDAKRLESIEEVEGLEQIASDMKSKLNELSIEMEDSWGQIKGDIHNSKKTINDAFARLNRSLV
ncbi:MAG: flagellar basal body-associated protein FliL [Sulfurimonas sp.]|jgi:flagellar basal body-associated protein FliL